MKWIQRKNVFGQTYTALLDAMGGEVACYYHVWRAEGLVIEGGELRISNNNPNGPRYIVAGMRKEFVSEREAREALVRHHAGAIVKVIPLFPSTLDVPRGTRWRRFLGSLINRKRT